MSKSTTPTTPKYVIDMKGCTLMAWKGKLPSVANLEKFVMEHVVSTYPGYVNQHLGENGISIPSFCRVRRNGGDRAVLVEWNAPRFMVMPNEVDYPRVAKISAISQ